MQKGIKLHCPACGEKIVMLTDKRSTKLTLWDMIAACPFCPAAVNAYPDKIVRQLQQELSPSLRQPSGKPRPNHKPPKGRRARR
jgi:hypothetical protein